MEEIGNTNKFGYVLNTAKREPETKRLYNRIELENMTTHQLRDICRREKIINGVLHPMDQEELIRVILRYRGEQDAYLITQHSIEGDTALEDFLMRSHKIFNSDYQLNGNATIVVYEDLSTQFYDQITMRYDERFVNTNAFVVSDDHKVCGIFNIKKKGENKDRLFLVRGKDMPCKMAVNSKNYSLFCFDQATSRFMQELYQGEFKNMPEKITIYSLSILDFSVRSPRPLQLPLAIDFGTTNTVAGAYLDNTYFEQNGELPGARGLQEDAVNYALFYDLAMGEEESVLLPSVVAIKSLEGGKPEYLFGYDAIKWVQSIYIDEGFSVFYDIKRWVGDFDKQEELIDRQGRQMLVQRKELIRVFLEYVIEQAANRFKCVVSTIHLSCPAKQKYLFQLLIDEILPQYRISFQETLEEGVTVLYNTISEKIASSNYENGVPHRALIIDCGGGTTDLCSCVYTITDKRVAYDIQIETTYENGDTNFGGNNLTYRILQLLKLEIAAQWGFSMKTSEIMQQLDIETYRYVDEHGATELYKALDQACGAAEEIFPTQFKYFEKHNRIDYFRVKENYYYLFRLAEQIKKVFFNRTGLLRVNLGAIQAQDTDISTAFIPIDKWKLSVMNKGHLRDVDVCPDVVLNIYDIELLLKADIYGIILKFLGPMYENEELYNYNSIKLSGQSCKIGIFADAIKEFIPGKIIQLRRVEKDMPEKDRLHMKLACVEGALQYLKDKNYGYANVAISSGVPALPYEITALTHHGQTVTLIHRLDRSKQHGHISRNMDDLTFKLFLVDDNQEQQYSYTYQCQSSDFTPVTYEELQEKYEIIEQEETDIIIDHEVKFFVWADSDNWGFWVLPVGRLDESLRMGKAKFFPFENDSWIMNFYDGTH